MTDLRKAAQQALEAGLESDNPYIRQLAANALRNVLQEPVHSVQSNGKHSPLLTHMMHKRAATPQPVQGQEPVAWEQFYPSMGKGPFTTPPLAEIASFSAAGLNATPPLPAQPEQEPVACRFCHSKKGSWAWQCYKCGEIDDVQQPASQPEQEPVAWMRPSEEGYDSAFRDHHTIVTCAGNPWKGWLPLYTAPPAVERPWVGLTDEEIAQGNKESWVTEQAWQSAVWWAEAKLKEKNNG